MLSKHCNHFTVYTYIYYIIMLELPCSSNGKELACNAGDLGSNPGSGSTSGEGMATHSSILAWRIPWTEESGELHSVGL